MIRLNFMIVSAHLAVICDCILQLFEQFDKYYGQIRFLCYNISKKIRACIKAAKGLNDENLIR